MPWSGKTFRQRHNKGLSPGRANKAAKIANAMLKNGAPEGKAIATANARAAGQPRKSFNRHYRAA